LPYESKGGRLRAILDHLDIPVSSQSRVHSPTSFQFRRVSPQTPRAIYFNDDVYVGWVQGGSLEFASFDPTQGAIFYLMDSEMRHPAIRRTSAECLSCHVAPATRGVPGVFLRSTYPAQTGEQEASPERFIAGHESPLESRWGGWYVTGRLGGQVHMGNSVSKPPGFAPPFTMRPTGRDWIDLTSVLNTSAYLSPYSDVVAQLVLAHQTQMHNLTTRTNYRTRIALYRETEAGARRQYESAAEEMLRYLLFVDEAPLIAPIAGTSGFEAEFAARGPRDSRGRSLRDFNLRERLFEYPCSYLVYSAAFDALPSPVKTYIYRRLSAILTGRDQSSAFARLTPPIRTAILEILLATKADFRAA